MIFVIIGILIIKLLKYSFIDKFQIILDIKIIFFLLLFIIILMVDDLKSFYNNHLFNQNLLTSITIIIAIVYVSIIYICLALFFTYKLDSHLFYFFEKDFYEENVLNTSLLMLIFNILITFSIISIISFILRNIVQLIPFPFNFANIDYHNIREVYTGSLILIIMITFSQTLNKQFKDIKYKLTNKVY